ncbi:hypothetical protein [Aeromonas simiae]|uniref:hypothetical protein n=1 Tax=Aeromonas simiae TaxID=218936 RepID=UPI00266DA837|nr:hypothetical protein [Aeromonas simiae]MDO2947016.1 hypothetical protein [Aeromonas simiae]MDO2950628.1 hypothetical protein [Aeromonas simiae]MDO2954390.1 hypothetical protein [Aeromonas simiae]
MAKGINYEAIHKTMTNASDRNKYQAKPTETGFHQKTKPLKSKIKIKLTQRKRYQWLFLNMK